MTRLVLGVFSFCLFCSNSFAQNSSHQTALSEEALFMRCYAHLSRQRPLPNNPLLVAVKSGSKTAVDACMELLDKAEFGVSGEIRNTSDREAIAVLSTVYDFHRSWFKILNFDGRPTTYSNGELRHHDSSEGALILTRTLLQQGRRYEEIVTSQSSARAIRSLGPWATIRKTGSALEEKQLRSSQAGLYRGVLTGVMSWDVSTNSKWFKDNGEFVEGLTQVQTLSALNTLRSFGGGIMGAQSYIWANSGFPSSGERDGRERESVTTVSNASIRMHRRWSQSVLSDLMCRELPVLRTADVNSMVEEYNLANIDSSMRLPFRQSTTCMSCHATIDPMAAIARNLVFHTDSGYDWDGNGTVDTADVDKTSWVKMRIPDQVAEAQPYHLMSRDGQFYRRPPKGYLKYRSYDGSFQSIDVQANNQQQALQSLGAGIAQKNDLYVCAASRYFEYFTGIKVSLHDEGDPRNPTLTAADRYYRDKVVEMGLELKSNQNLKSLVRSIISSDIYRKTGMRDLEP